ncbi:hypothetical protein SLE2022_130770 [Rubroshorea leprosula]
MATISCNRRYKEFEPLCKWKHDGCSDTVELDLKGFKLEHLNVTINHCAGILSITGERPLENTITSWFRKEIKLPYNIKTNEIWAKFGCGVLTIIMPKKTTLVPRLSEDCCGKLLADHVGRASFMGSGPKVVAICPDEECWTKYMAVGGIVAVITLLVLAGVCWCRL